MAKFDWLRATRQRLCAICGGSDNCEGSMDGRWWFCGRVQKGSVRTNGGGQFLHDLGDDQRRRDDIGDYEHPSHRRATSKIPKAESGTPNNFANIAQLAFDRPDAVSRRLELASILGVDVRSLERLKVGPWGHQDGLHWLFPERNAAGDFIGLNRRYRDGSKIAWPGSQRGLVYCDDWQTIEGPVYLVEGPSDTAAMLSFGVCVVGRPSNTGGVEHLMELLANVPREREVIVLGENDRKSHESLKRAAKARHKADCDCCSICWPGSFGATTTATKLAEQLGRNIEVMFPPDGSKDVREMVHMLGGAT